MDKSKLEALDLVINVLKEHEKRLDGLVERLDTLIDAFSRIQTRLEHMCNKIEQTTR